MSCDFGSPHFRRRTAGSLTVNWQVHGETNTPSSTLSIDSYGRAIFDPNVISQEVDSEFRWYSRYLPKT